MINWLSQIASVTWFGMCTIPRRKGSALATTAALIAASNIQSETIRIKRPPCTASQKLL